MGSPTEGADALDGLAALATDNATTSAEATINVFVFMETDSNEIRGNIASVNFGSSTAAS